MKRIVCVSFSSSAYNFDEKFKFLGEEFHLSRFGADFNIKIMQILLKTYDGQADVIAIQGEHPPVQVGRKIYTHKESEYLKSLVKNSHLVTGEVFRKIYLPWAVRTYAKQNPGFFKNKRVAFYSGILDLPLVQTLTQYTDRVTFLDPAIHFGLRKEIKSIEGLVTYIRALSPLLKKIPLSRGTKEKRKFRFKGFTNAEIYVTRAQLLERFSFDHLEGKTIMVDTVSPQMFRQLKEAGVANVFQTMPEIKELNSLVHMDFDILEAILQALRKDWEPLNEDEILGFIEELDLKPRVQVLSANISVEKKNKFAFIVHPLWTSELFRVPLLKPLMHLGKGIEPILEKMANHAPCTLYGKISGIRSTSTGKETEGLIYLIPATPKMLLTNNTEDTYRKLIQITETAADAGAKIIGLGAYTKIVGDAGVTVSKNSPIPVTTGNSLSAAATLWAAREACAKMGFVVPYESGKVMHAKVMVIGATGSIGAVCAKMLARIVDELVLCSRGATKLLELREEILEIAPHCKVTLVTNPNNDAESCDLIVTSTSSHDKKVLDISKVKPGCVICDVSRPLDIKPEDALSRPDVLVIESGEIELPGKIELTCDMGTPDGATFACLAETALLALEGRFEAFTLSRHISYQRVSEIYDIAKHHGAKLAAIRGHSGAITDFEIALCREHALKALNQWPKQ